MPDDQRDSEMRDFRLRGYHGIPDDGKLQAMSYLQLSDILRSCDKDSTKFHVVEREVKRRLAKDQAEINRSNVFFGACVGGIFGLSGVVLGYYLNSENMRKQVPPASTVQQIGNSNLTVKPPVNPNPIGTQSPVVIPAWQLAPSAPPAAQPANNPTPIQNNAQPRSSNP